MTTLHLIDKLLTLGIFVVIATAVWSMYPRRVRELPEARKESVPEIQSEEVSPQPQYAPVFMEREEVVAKPLIVRDLTDKATLLVRHRMTKRACTAQRLSTKAESVLALEKSDKLVIDKYMKDMLMSVKTVAGAYSEVFVHGGQMGCGIGRVLFDPFSLLLVSSKAEDFEAVRHYRDRGYSIVDALESVLADRGIPGYTHKNNRKAA